MGYRIHSYSNRRVEWTAAAALFLLLMAISGRPLWAQTAQPEANLPAQAIGPNDLVAISVYGESALTRTVRIGAGGALRLPMLSRTIEAQGLLPAELETRIAEALRAEQILVDPVVTVTVVEYQSRPISVAGAVNTPVTFQAIGTVTLLEALARAGGFTPEAGSYILVTKRTPGGNGSPETLTRRIAVKALMDAADPGVNLRLTGGEEIRVPEAGRIFVVGNVKKPGAFRAEDGSDTSVLKALALAEGLTPFASKQAYVIRRNDVTGGTNEVPIELKKILARKASDVPLFADDILYIPDNSGRRASMTALAKVAGFATATLSGVLIYSSFR